MFFTWRNTAKKYDQLFVWFEKWIIGKRTFSTLREESKYSKRTLQNYFEYYLNRPPLFTIPQKEKVRLIIDGSYFSNNICLIVYRNQDIKMTQLYRLTDAEITEEIIEDLQNLRKMSIEVISITCDGHRAILKAIRKVFKGKVLVQRCLVHIQRMGKIWLTKEPKSLAGLELLKLIYSIHTVSTAEQRLIWLRALYDWDQRYKEFIGEISINPATGRTWYTHKMVRRVRYMLIHAFTDMFHYLDDPLIPNSTNALESFFGHLKDNLRIHRGLTKRNRQNFIKWYLYLRNNHR